MALTIYRVDKLAIALADDYRSNIYIELENGDGFYTEKPILNKTIRKRWYLPSITHVIVEEEMDLYIKDNKPKIRRVNVRMTHFIENKSHVHDIRRFKFKKL